MHCALPYSKQEVEDAFHGVLLLAREQADMNKIDGLECADDFIAEKSIIIVEYVYNMVKDTPEDATDSQQ